MLLVLLFAEMSTRWQNKTVWRVLLLARGGMLYMTSFHKDGS